MNFLPLEIEELIYNYKKEFEIYEKRYKDLENWVRKQYLCPNDFSHNLDENGYSLGLYNILYHVNRIYKNVKLTKEEVYKIMIERIPTMKKSTFGFVPFRDEPIYWKGYIGCGEYGYAKIEELPIEFIDHFKDQICWDYVGSGKFGYTSMEDLPEDFKERYKYKLSKKTWLKFCGSLLSEWFSHQI